MFETERLQFKISTSKYEKDLEQLFCENHKVMKTALKGRVFTREEFKALLQGNFTQSTDDITGFLCVISKLDNKLIGVSGLLKCNYLNKDTYEFGFILHDAYWGKGLATEIGQFWLETAKKELYLTELLATVSPENKASINVLEKLDMEFVDEFISKERGCRLIYRKGI